MEQKSTTDGQAVFLSYDNNSSHYKNLIENAGAWVSYKLEEQPSLDAIKQGKFDLALRQACAVGAKYLVEILLNYLTLEHPNNVRACIEAQSSNGKNALHWAANPNGIRSSLSILSILSMLLKHNPDTSLCDIKGNQFF